MCYPTCVSSHELWYYVCEKGASLLKTHHFAQSGWLLHHAICAHVGPSCKTALLASQGTLTRLDLTTLKSCNYEYLAQEALSLYFLLVSGGWDPVRCSAGLGLQEARYP